MENYAEEAAEILSIHPSWLPLLARVLVEQHARTLKDALGECVKAHIDRPRVS